MTELADTETFEWVAELLWTVRRTPHRPMVWRPDLDAAHRCRRIAEELPARTLSELIRAYAATLSFVRPWSSENDSVASYGSWLLFTMAAALPQRSRIAPAAEARYPFAALLASRIAGRDVSVEFVQLLNAALILLADHDLPESTRIVRMAAGAGVAPPDIVRLGIDIKAGPVRSAAFLGLPRLLDLAAVAAPVHGYRPRQGEPVPGFGHAAYPNGDPRAQYIMERLRAIAPATMTRIDATLKNSRADLPKPNVGFALAALIDALDAPQESVETVFVLARAAGWLAHAQEEYLQMSARESHHSVHINEITDRRLEHV